MATAKTTANEEQKYVVNLFYDGDKYKDALPVIINGKTFYVKRGEPVEVPKSVYEVIQNMQAQQADASRTIAQLQKPETFDF